MHVKDVCDLAPLQRDENATRRPASSKRRLAKAGPALRTTLKQGLIRPRALVVLGMHRSGTSMLTGAMSRIGYGLPKMMLPPAGDNPKGFFESKAVVDLNNQILREIGFLPNIPWADPRPWTEDLLGRSDSAHIIARIENTLIQEFSGHSAFVLKDPRLCRLFPLWRQALENCGAEVQPYLAFRNPLSVAASLTARNGLRPADAVLLWLVYNVEAERSTRNLYRQYVHFEDMIQGAKVEVRAATAIDNVDAPTIAPLVALSPEIDGALINHQHQMTELMNASTVPSIVKTMYSSLRSEGLSKITQQKIDEAAINLRIFWDIALPKWELNVDK